MGVNYDSAGYAIWGSNWRTENRLRLNFTVAVEGDHGLTFGAFTRAQMQSAGSTAGTAPASGASFSGSRVWVEANGLRLTFGNQDGAIQQFGYVGGQFVGYTGGTFAGSSAGMAIYPQGFDSTGAGYPRIGLQYTMGDTVIALSHDRAHTANATASATEIAVRSRFDAITVALGYANRRNSAPAATAATIPLYLDDSSILTGSVNYNAGSFQVGLIAARIEGLGTNYALTGRVDLAGGFVHGYVGRYLDTNPLTSDTTYGIGYSYGLGGGASFGIGVERTNGRTQGSAGVVFNF
jgi:outer membrane protein OmpU